MSGDDIAALAKQRLIKPFADKAAVKEYLKSIPATTIDDSIDVTSRYFSVSIAIDTLLYDTRTRASRRRARLLREVLDEASIAEKENAA